MKCWSCKKYFIGLVPKGKISDDRIFCSPECYNHDTLCSAYFKECEARLGSRYVKVVKDPIIKFIKSRWGCLQVRVGKYRDKANERTRKAYKNINLCISYGEFYSWCFKNRKTILSMDWPSIDRIDPSKDYTIDNMRILEFKDNCSRRLNNIVTNCK